MSILEIIIYSLIGLAVVYYLINKLFIKPHKREKIKQSQEEANKATEED